jgi:hypothetical protein
VLPPLRPIGRRAHGAAAREPVVNDGLLLKATTTGYRASSARVGVLANASRSTTALTFGRAASWLWSTVGMSTGSEYTIRTEKCRRDSPPAPSSASHPGQEGPSPLCSELAPREATAREPCPSFPRTCEGAYPAAGAARIVPWQQMASAVRGRNLFLAQPGELTCCQATLGPCGHSGCRREGTARDSPRPCPPEDGVRCQALRAWRSWLPSTR